MPKAAVKPARYRQDVAVVVSRVVVKLAGVREKKGVSGRPQFFAAERLFAFIASDGVALKLPADVVEQVVDNIDYLPFKMRNKPVLREWIRVRHADAAEYRADAALFRQAVKFVTGQPERREQVTPAGAARAPRRQAR